MAKKKKAAPVVVKKTKKKPVVEHLDGMYPPNHNRPLALPRAENLGKEYDTQRFPTLHLALADGISPKQLAFVDKRYGCTAWTDRAVGAPPTWMDSEIFVRMLLKTPAIKEAIAKCIRLGSKKHLKPMLPLITEVFETKYLEYLFSQMNEEVMMILAEFMLAHVADKKNYPEGSPSQK